MKQKNGDAQLTVRNVAENGTAQAENVFRIFFVPEKEEIKYK